MISATLPPSSPRLIQVRSIDRSPMNRRISPPRERSWIWRGAMPCRCQYIRMPQLQDDLVADLLRDRELPGPQHTVGDRHPGQDAQLDQGDLPGRLGPRAEGLGADRVGDHPHEQHEHDQCAGFARARAAPPGRPASGAGRRG